MLNYVRCVAFLVAVGSKINAIFFNVKRSSIPKYGWNFALTFFPPLNLEIVFALNFVFAAVAFDFNSLVYYYVCIKTGSQVKVHSKRSSFVSFAIRQASKTCRSIQALAKVNFTNALS